MKVSAFYFGGTFAYLLIERLLVWPIWLVCLFVFFKLFKRCVENAAVDDLMSGNLVLYHDFQLHSELSKICSPLLTHLIVTELVFTY